MQNLKNWFVAQTLSSKVLVSAAGVMIIIFLMVEFAFVPWKAKLNNLRLSVEDNIATVAWMTNQVQQNKSQITQANSKSNLPAKNTTSLITRVEQSAKKQKIYSNVERISPDKLGRVKVWINNGNFQQWLKWIDQLKRDNIDVIDARVSQSAAQAPVSINVTFAAAD